MAHSGAMRSPRWKNADAAVLRKRYPVIYRDPDCSVSFPAGWSKMLDELSAKLESMALVQKSTDRILVAQVKSKYGQLRFYADNLPPEAEKLVGEFEERSSMVCEACGATDATNYDEDSWYVTKCERCRVAFQVMDS